jgi:hypothetical protein
VFRHFRREGSWLLKNHYYRSPDDAIDRRTEFGVRARLAPESLLGVVEFVRQKANVVVWDLVARKSFCRGPPTDVATALGSDLLHSQQSSLTGNARYVGRDAYTVRALF